MAMVSMTDTSQSYKIMEAAKLSGLPESTLRYYENIGIIKPINRDSSSKHRVYSEDDLNVLVSIACLSATGMSISNIRKYLKNRSEGAEAAHEQIELLKTQQKRLVDAHEHLKLRQQYVELKIDYWRAIGEGKESEANIISSKAKVIATKLNLQKENQ
jgi:DNA-binding transcriptional MerR regulator